MSTLTLLAGCFMSGVVSGITVWCLARFGVLPVIGIMYVEKEEE